MRADVSSAKRPAPSFTSTDSVPALPKTRSGSPSPSTSPATTAFDTVRPGMRSEASVNTPRPSFR
jgi:hypothetical protein